MKQFLVLAAVLPLMLIFFVQFSLDQINSSRIAVFSDLVYSAKEEARQEGCFTDSIKADLRRKISSALGIRESDIVIEATDTVQYRLISAEGYTDSNWKRGLIYYKVSVPIGQVMAGKSMFGIKDEDNEYYYTIENYAASERLPL
ncbi:MAG: hypothetical protein IJM08_03280 [Firmicutes bacterium]|jgi:hypothetical protein|nr:hypothetical protein [Bacillota bacterium]